MWDASYMEAETPLQRFIRQALQNAPGKRDSYDKILQKRLGTTGKPIYDIDRGKSKNPSSNILTAVSEVLRQPLDLLNRAVQGEVVDAVEWFEMAPDLPPVVMSTRNDGCVSLRVLDLDLSMGDGSNIDDFAEEGAMDFDAGLIRKITRTPPERLFVARGSGDSMSPTLVNGDMVVIDPTQTTLNLDDRIWAISLFGAGGIKRLQPVAHGQVNVISDNPFRENRVVPVEDIRILGRVIWVGREV